MQKTSSNIHSGRYEYLEKEFLQYQYLMSSLQNNHESVFKTNRDVTKESKKIIYTLHRIPGMSEDEKMNILSEAHEGLVQIRDDLMCKITGVMKNDPNFLYTKVCLSGMEEFVEAILFFSFLRQNKLLSFNEVRHFLFHTKEDCTKLKDHIIKETVDKVKNSNTLDIVNNGKSTDDGIETTTTSTIGTDILKRELREDTDIYVNHKLNVNNCCEYLHKCSIYKNNWESSKGNKSSELFGEDVLVCREEHWYQILNFETYVLAMGDVSGETLRYYIKSNIVKDFEASQLALTLLRQMKECYQFLPPSDISKSMKNKIEVHGRNLLKAEKMSCDNSMLDLDALSWAPN